MSHFKTYLRWAPLALALAMAAATSTAYAKDIVIGVPIAQTGPIAFVGVPGLHAMQLAADQANDTGMFGADKIKLDVADDASDRTQSVTLVNKMIQADKAIAIVGLAGTTMALGGSAVANDFHVPAMTMATSPAVTKVGDYAFHVMASPNLQIATAAQYLYDHQKPKTLATIWGRDNEGAVAQGKYAREWFEGKTTLLPEESVLGSETDFSALATKLASQHPDAVFITPASEANAAALVLQMRQAGVTATFMGTNAMAGQGFIRMDGKAAEGVFAPSDYLVTSNVEMNPAFVAAYTKKFGSPPDNWAALGYTAMLSVLHAIKAAGPDATPQAVRDALVKTHDMPTVIGTGTFSLDSGREPSYQMAIVVVKDGKWVEAPK